MRQNEFNKLHRTLKAPKTQSGVSTGWWLVIGQTSDFSHEFDMIFKS